MKMKWRICLEVSENRLVGWGKVLVGWENCLSGWRTVGQPGEAVAILHIEKLS